MANKLRDRVLAAYPNCIFCGGRISASTIDHVPPRAIFEGRNRPGGLEVPACEPCNSGARQDEQIAAMLSRAYPDATTEAGRQEFVRAMAGVCNNVPGLIE